MFSAKIYKYESGYQVRVYERGFIEKSKGEYYLGGAESQERDLNPFSGKWERIPDLPDPGRSAKVSMSRTKQHVYYLSRSNAFEWFVTLTFDPEKVDSFDYDCCVRHLSDWLSNAKKRCPGMRYIVVPEQHRSGRFHFHGLFACCDALNFVDSGHRAKGEVIYNIGSYRLGFTTATRIKDGNRVARYICKYITKDFCSVSRGRRRFWASRNLRRAEIKSVMVTAGKRDALCEYLAKLSCYVKHLEHPLNSVTYFDLLVSADLDIEPFLRSQ